MSEAPIKKRRGRPQGSYKKPEASKIFERMSPQDKTFLQEAREGDLYPAREHKVVERACAAIENETGIIVAGDARLLLYAAHQSLVAWTIHDHGLAGLYGLPSNAPGMAKGKRRAEVFLLIRFAFEKASGKKARLAHSAGRGGAFCRFARIALAVLAPPGFAPSHAYALAKAIENSRNNWKRRFGLSSRQFLYTSNLSGFDFFLIIGTIFF